MNTLIVSTFDCTFEDFDKFVADFHEKEGHKYVEEYELIKVNDHKSHLILKVKDLEGFAAATSCLLYTSPSPRDGTKSRMPSSA